MKKTMIALAAVAAMGAASAQVSITGGVDFNIGKHDFAGAQKGIVSTDAYIDISVSEDLGGGMKASSFMEINVDGGFQTGAYSGDKSFTLSSPMGALTLANTRTGGTIGAVLMAPVVTYTDHWSAATASIVSRSPIDALVLTVPVAPGLSVAYKYLEVKDPGVVSPAVTVNVLSGKYTTGPISVAGDFAMYEGAPYKVADVRTTKLTLNAIYDAGVAKVGLGYDGATAGTANSLSTGSAAGVMVAGISIPLGNITAGLNYAKRDTNSFVEAGATYSLSKKTFVTASYGNFDIGGTSSDVYAIRLGQSF